VIQFQETKGEGKKFIGGMGTLLKYWDCMAFDVIANRRCILTSWKKLIHLINYFSIDSSIWIEFMFKDLGQKISVIN